MAREQAALDWQTCEKARLAKDARFDGRFFTGVLTTGIFCRPICPAPAPKSDNVRYFSSAAAASEAGFRPCLRCRPEAAPGSPLWLGGAAVVSRAQVMIHEGFLNQHGMKELALRLGVSERQLRRLFHEQIGAAPKTVAAMQRLLFAKKLLAETRLSMTDVALAAGFNSLRRFNDALRKTYGQAPSMLRRQSAAVMSDQLTLLLPYRPPLAWQAMLSFLRLRAIPGVEQVSESAYRRSICLNGQVGWFAVEQLSGQTALQLTLSFPDLSQLMVIVARVRRLFDLDANYEAVYQALSVDPQLQKLMDAEPGLRLPGAWEPFEFVVRAVLGQQISVKAATTIAGRVAARFGAPLLQPDSGLERVFPTAATLAAADLSGLGLTARRMETLAGLARAVSTGALELRVGHDLETFVRALCELPGVGEWTAHYIAMRALGEPDAFPASDLGLMKALGVTKPRAIEKYAEAWRPWRAYAAIQLWHSLG